MSNEAVMCRDVREAAWKQAARRRGPKHRVRMGHASVLALLAAVIALAPLPTFAQMGQSAMAPNGGVVGRAVAGLQRLNSDGPGLLYYGINAADRGLGYRGSYMTAGGFIPVAEDDLGGFWSADLRGHLSTYGGFFSNVGAVRKQFIGGTLLGLGVYWDYDGDMNQYPDTVLPYTPSSSSVFQGGRPYNQVGISGEWLTDYGNIRSNGYVPLGETAQLQGPFFGNYVLCQNGINAALGGADLEVGAYIPGLTDWAGMISVGGYALGNTRYSFPDGADAVPWFGGVYTRLDMTFLENWDFSLQANNDSYFDWTGFARLTYRMGSSRRRTVPDQIEQPMMRNEHIARAHQVPEIALNPCNNGAPWLVFHVDNTAAPGGNGTNETPFATLGQAATAATNPFDIIYLHAGGGAAMPYITPVGGFTFGNDNQYLLGEGSPITIPTVSCGDRSFFGGSTPAIYPVISNPAGPAIVMNRQNLTVSHLQISESRIGISDGGAGVNAPNVAVVTDVIITGNAGTGAPAQRGIDIQASTGRFYFDDIRLTDLTDGGLVAGATNANVEIVNSSFQNVTGGAIVVSGSGASVQAASLDIDTADIAASVSGPNASLQMQRARIRNLSGDGIHVSGSAATAELWRTTISDVLGTGLAVTAPGPSAGARLTADETTVDRADTGATVTGAGNTLQLASSHIRDSASNGLSVSGTNHVVNVFARSSITRSGQNGIVAGELSPVAGLTMTVEQSDVESAAVDLIRVNNTTTPFGTPSVVTIWMSQVSDAPNGKAIHAINLRGGAEVLRVYGTTVADTFGGGIHAENSNLDVGPDPTVRLGGAATSVTNTGLFGIRAEVTDPAAPLTINALVQDARVSGAVEGIVGLANTGDRLNLTLLENRIQQTGPQSIYLDTNGAGSFINTYIYSNHGIADPLAIEFTSGSTKAVKALDLVNLAAINAPSTITFDPLAPPIFNPALIVPLPPGRPDPGTLFPPFVPTARPADAPLLPIQPETCD